MFEPASTFQNLSISPRKWASLPISYRVVILVWAGPGHFSVFPWVCLELLALQSTRYPPIHLARPGDWLAKAVWWCHKAFSQWESRSYLKAALSLARWLMSVRSLQLGPWTMIILYSAAMTWVDHTSRYKFKLTKTTSYLTLMGKLWDIYCIQGKFDLVNLEKSY